MIYTVSIIIISLYIGLAIKGEGFYCKHILATATTHHKLALIPPRTLAANPLGPTQPGLHCGLENPKKCPDGVAAPYHRYKSQSVLNYRLT